MATDTVELSVGERSHRVLLENPGGSVPDGDGGFIEGWVPIGNAWGRVAPASAEDVERVVAGTVTALLPYIVTVPYLAGVSTLTRVTYHGRLFAVLGVRNVDERNVRLEVICEERSGSPGESLQGVA